MMKIPDFSKIGFRFQESKTATIVLSILSAILIWFILSITVYTTAPLTFYNIPLEVDITGTVTEASGLSVIEKDVETVNLQIEGNRSQVGILTADDLTAYAVVENISSTGTYTLDITVKAKDNIKFDITSISPSTVNVRFDKIETRSFPVTAEIPKITVTAGHTMDVDDIVCSPDTVRITGPTSQLDQIDSVHVYSDSDLEIEASYILNSSEVILYTANGSILDPKDLTIEDTNFQISIPIMTQKELLLSYGIQNIPSGFDEKWLRERLELSAETITFASPDSALAKLETWDITGAKPISLEDIVLDYTTTMDIPQKEGYLNQSGIQQATLTLNNEGLSQRDFIVNSDNISVINAPSDYECNVITKNLTITVIGPTEELNELRTKDITVTVDLLNYDTEQSQSFTLDSYISFSSSHMWAVGKYKIALETVERTEAET